MAKGDSLSLNTKKGKVREALRNPIDVLKSIESKACIKDYHYERLYRNLYNPEFYLLAYGNIYAKEGNMTPGADGNTIDGMGLEIVDKIIDSMKNHSYKPNPARRIYIEKKGNTNKKRPLGIPSFEDKLIQEVVRMILQSIYEPNFSNLSHGFRPQRSCHTALLQLQANFTGVKWFIEGDIKSFFDTIDHHILVDILRRRIKDEYFIALIWKFLKAGYIENWRFNNTYSGTPQGSIISPLLSSIYLNELDVFMEEYIQEFNNGKRRKRNPEYSKYDNQLQRIKRTKYTPEQWELLTKEEKALGLETIKDIRKEMLTKEYSDPQDNGYKRLFYVRYADDWLCGVIGSKTETEFIKADIKEFLNKKLKLELSESKTLITNAQDKARFLGFDVMVSNDNSYTKTGKGVTQRTRLRKIQLYVPREKWQNKLIEYKALKLNYHKEQGYNEVFEPVHRNYLINNEDLEIVKQYNSEIRGMYNYYKIADNVSVLNSFYYVMKFSMLKTFAAKYKSRIGNMRNKYGHKRFGVRYHTKSGENIMYFYDEGFRKDKNAIANAEVDAVSRTFGNSGSSSLVDRLKANKCEWCGAENTVIEIHHIKKLKDLKGKKEWEIKMIGRRRKTMALCKKCHVDLHAGRLD